MGYLFKAMWMTFIVGGKSVSMVLGLMQWALPDVETSCDEVRLLAYPDKTELVVLTRRRKLSGFFEPHCFWVTLSCCMSDKDLRGVLGSHLTWRKHVDVKVRKAGNLLLTCWRSCGATWGLRPKVVHWLCVSVIQPSITLHLQFGGLTVRWLVPRKE